MSLGINARITNTIEQPSTFSRGKTPYVGGKGEGKTYIMTSWYEQAKLLASDGADGDDFGYSVSLDGDTALIGAFCDDPYGDRSGSAYVFKGNGTNWTEEAKLIASDGAERDMFGFSVSLDGDTALIGAHKDNDSGINSGSAYVFKRNETGWIQQAKLLAIDGASHDKFGISVSLDGDTALIGAYGDNNNKGSAYLFKYDGTNWTQQAKIPPTPEGSFYWLGRSVFLDGDRALIGAMRSYDKGSAYVFKYDGAVWNEEAKLLAPDGGPCGYFGCSVSIDGDTALIGAYNEDGNVLYSGAVYMFKCDGTSWEWEAKLMASDGADDDNFGYSVSLDGNTALIGAYGDDNKMGSAYLFKPLNGNAPPHAPDIDGQISGGVGTEYGYTFNAVDPNKDDVKYYIDWGDGGSQTTAFSPSGTDVKVKHTWSKQGTYTIKAKAKDIHGLVGPEGTLTVTMPRNRAFRFIDMFPILRLLLQR